MNNDIIGKILSIMHEKRISYRDLEKSTGISKSTLQRYITGIKDGITLDNLEAIAKALNVDTAYLLGWTEYSNHENALLEVVNDFSDSEFNELMNYAKFIRMKRNEIQSKKGGEYDE